MKYKVRQQISANLGFFVISIVAVSLSRVIEKFEKEHLCIFQHLYIIVYVFIIHYNCKRHHRSSSTE